MIIIYRIIIVILINTFINLKAAILAKCTTTIMLLNRS